MLFRLILFIVLTLSVWIGETYYLNTFQPNYSAEMAVKQLNGGGTPNDDLRQYEFTKNLAVTGTGIVTALFALILFYPEIKKISGHVKKECSKKVN